MGPQTSPSRNRLYRILLSSGLATGVAIALQQLGSLQILETSLLDQFFALGRTVPAQSPPPAPPAVTLITITEADLAQLPQWPLSDAQLAALLSQIRQAQPAAIGLNLHRNLPLEPGSAQLAQVFATTPNLIGIEKVVGNAQMPAVPGPAVLAAQDQLAASDLVVDSDGKLRRQLISLVTPEGELRWSLGARLAFDYLAQRGIEPEVVEPGWVARLGQFGLDPFGLNQTGLDQSRFGQTRLGQALFRPLLERDGGYGREDLGGYQILSNFYASPQAFDRVSLTALRAGEIPPEKLRDRIVLIGPGAPSLQNPFMTPVSQSLDQKWYGVELQANLASQIIAAALGERSLLRGAPQAVGWLWILTWATVGATAGSLLPLDRRGSSLLWVLPLGLLALGGSSYLWFLQGWWLVVAAPGLSLLGASLLSRRLLLDQTLARSQHQLHSHLQSFERTLTRQIQVRTQALQSQTQQLAQAKQMAERASEAKSSFLARMSHELRVPLNSILGFSRILHDEASLDPDSHSSLEVIQSSSEHLLSLINDVLDISKIESNQISLNEQVVHLPSFLDRLKAMFQPQAKAKSLSFRCAVDGQLPEHLWLDETKLRQVLINLLGNAVKFTHHGHVILRVWRRVEDPTTLYFEVEDTGPGLLESEIDRVFEPFIQGAASSTQLQGTGLGLFISRQLIQRMGGELSVRSQWRQGAKFQVVLPLREAHRPLQALPSLRRTQERRLPDPDPIRYRILVVDDVAFNRKLLAKLLMDLGMDVCEASNGQEAVALWETWKPQLILMDIAMPEVDGCQATRQIRALEAAQGRSPIPIIATSGGVLPEEQSAALAAGCNALAPKPIQREQLLDAIATAFQS